MKKIIYGVTLLLCTASGAAMAQSVGAPAAETTDKPAAAADKGQLEEIIVTANRREEKLQDVPIAVTAITGRALAAAGIDSAREITQVVPNFTFARNNTNFQPVLRGIGTSLTGPGDESSVAVYVDGVYQADETATDFDLLEVDRIEVLRGPQGTLFGRNATGGLINIITPLPKFTPSGNISARYGSFNERTVRGYATTGLTDTIAVDLAAFASKDDGYIRDIVRGGMINPREDYAARTKFLYKPSNTATFTLSLNASYHNDNTAPSGYPVDGDTKGRAVNPAVMLADGPYDAAPGTKPWLKSRQYGGAFQTHFDLGSANLETTTSYEYAYTSLGSDSDQSLTPVQIALSVQNTDTYTQEVKLSSPTNGKLEWMVGAFGFLNRADNSPIRIVSSVTTLEDPRAIDKSLAAFADGAYKFTDQLKLILGIRYTFEEKYFRQTINGVNLVNTHANFGQATPRAVLQYYVTPTTNVYASYSRGFKSGTYNAYGASATPVQPETVDAFEIGMKSDPTRSLRVNLAAFYDNYVNLQIQARDGVTGIYTLQNAARAKISGAEAELTYIATDDISISASASLLDAKYSKFPGAPVTYPLPQGGNTQVGVDVSGTDMIRAPRYTFNLAPRYQHTFNFGDAGASVNIYHSAKVYWGYDDTLAQSEYTLINGEVFWKPTSRVRVSIWGKNLTNAVVAQQILTSALSTYRTNEKPVSGGVALRLDF